MASFEILIDQCHERWRRGAEDFQRLLGPKLRKKLPKARTIRSAVYGNMEFRAEEMRFIESFYIQRLRRVSQMGLLNLVYPDARHSRFEHSLGVLFSLNQLFAGDSKVKDRLSDKEKNTLRFAALLHDFGHGPFSHTTEAILEMSGLAPMLRVVQKGEDDHVKPHERRCRDMILDEDFHLSNLRITSYGVRDTLVTFGVDPQKVVDLVVGNQPPPMINLLSGDFDVDKMDYIRRDAFFTGTLGGGVDMDAMQRWVGVVGTRSSAKLAYDRRLVGHLIHLLFSREHIYNVTAFHPVSRVAAALLLVAADLALKALPSGEAALIYENLELFDDQELLSVLEIASATPKNDEMSLLKRVVQRLYLRRLPKRLKTLSRGDFAKAFNSCLPEIEKGIDKKNELPQLVYCRVSDISGGKYIKYLSAKDPMDDLVILEMSPKIGVIGDGVDAFEKELDALKRIAIKESEGDTRGISLAKWLDRHVAAEASEAQARALRAYKLAIWRALVLVPASLRYGLESAKLSDAFISDFSDALRDSKKRRPAFVTRSSGAIAIGTVGQTVEGWRATLP